MGYISSFVYCDTIQTEMTAQGPRAQIVSPLQVLAPIAIPGNFSFSVSCNLAGFDAEAENRIRLQFISPGGEIIYDTNDVGFRIPAEQLQEGKPAAMQFNMDFRNFVFAETGLFSTKIILNNDPIGEYKIEVMVGEMK